MPKTLHIINGVLLLAIFMVGTALSNGVCAEPSEFYGGGDFSSSGERPRGLFSIVDRFTLHYRWNRANLDENYLDNAVQMMRLRHYLTESPRIDSITIYAYASPEGVYEHNMRLAEQRAEAAERYVLAQLAGKGDFDVSRVRIRPMGENWTGLEADIENNYRRHDRERVLDILRAPVSNDTKKWRLKQLDGGYTYGYIIRRHMPGLRAAALVCVWRSRKASPLASPLHFSVSGLDAEAMALPQADTMPVRVPKSCDSANVNTGPAKEATCDKRTFIGLKTNLLYDAATVLNFAVEVPFNRNFSILYEHHCPWWLSRNNRYCLEFLSFGGEFRWWFRPKTREASADLVKRDALVGHFLGLYGMGGKFDIQANRKFCYQGEFFSAGLTYGYSMPVSRRLNMEFSISVGYARIPYRHYIPTDDWELLVRDPDKAGVLHYFGPTKVEVSLVVPLLVNVKRRGGAR